jgi:hypothetical protein
MRHNFQTSLRKLWGKHAQIQFVKGQLVGIKTLLLAELALCN